MSANQDNVDLDSGLGLEPAAADDANVVVAAPMPIRIVANSWCYQKSKAFECTYLWTVENFSFYTNTTISSLKFIPSDENREEEYRFKWGLTLYPEKRPVNEHEGHFISLFLKCHPNFDFENVDFEVKAIALFYIIDRDGEMTQIFEQDRSLVSFTPKNEVYAFLKYTSLEVYNQDPDRYFPNDTFTIYCKIKSLVDIEYKTGPETLLAIEKHAFKEEKDLDYDDLWANRGIGGNVLFVTEQDGGHFWAHSEVLKKRFPGFYKEAYTNEIVTTIKVPKVEANIFHRILLFVYKQKVPSMNIMARRMLVAAYQFDFVPLIRFCEETLVPQVNDDNVVELLELSQQHYANRLQLRCVDHIRSNPLHEFASKVRGNLLIRNPDLVYDMFDAY